MIRAHVTDAQALAARTPTDVSQYLRSTGWELADRTDTLATWTRRADSGDEFEVLQPLDTTLRDYAARVGGVVSTLALVEDRSELDILHAISQVSQDVQSVRIFPAEESPGLLGLEDGVTLYESLRNLVVACAYPVVARQRRLVQPSRKPGDLDAFLRTVRIGPAVEGSYALSVHTPIPPRLADHEQPTLFGEDAEDAPADDDPVGRKVSLQMYEAVQAASQAVDSALVTSDGLAPFTAAVDHGLSANLCEALAGLGGEAGHPFELSFSLAAVRGGPRRLAPVRFSREQLPLLREAAAELRSRNPEQDVAVTGAVVRLHRESGDEAGEITLYARVGAQDMRRIRLRLTGTHYDRAVRAHEEEREVHISGDLVRRGNRFVLENPYDFQLLEGP